MNDAPSLLKNSGEKKNWMLIKTVGKKSNRNGFGARVTVIKAIPSRSMIPQWRELHFL